MTTAPGTADPRLSRAMERVLELVEKGEIVPVAYVLDATDEVTTGSWSWRHEPTGEYVRPTVVALQKRGLVKLRAVGNPGKAALTNEGRAYRERKRAAQ